VGKIAIFTDDPGWHGKQLKQAFASRGYDSDYVSLTMCKIQLAEAGTMIQIPGFEEKLPDAVFVRGVPGGSLQEVVFYLDILHALKQMNIPVYNDGHAIERSVDKGMTSFLLKNAGLPTPFTWVVRDREQALAIAEEQLKQGHYLISKPLFGSQGEGIRRIEKMTDLLWLTSSNGIYYLQRFVECAGESYSDIRVFVVNGTVIAAMRRCGGKSWLNNVARGASCEAIAVNHELAQLAIKATEILKMDYAGVDIIQEANGGYSIIEVNSIPAWKGLESVCDVTVAEHLAHDLINRCLGLNCQKANNFTEQLAQAYIEACEVDVQAFKPGNVSVYSEGHDMTVADFRRSAQASAAAITNPAYSLGEKIFYAVKATQEAVGCNTNLGIILLCAPLITAAYQVTKTVSLRQALAQVLENTTIDDADWAFKAISLAAPGGLGKAGKHDVSTKAEITLTQAMAMASDRDRIALQYANCYADILNFAVLRYNTVFDFFLNRDWAAVAVYTALLSRYPDSHVMRKYGNQHNGWISEQMLIVDHAVTHYARLDLINLLYKVDQDFKSKGINPGTTADLTVATMFVIFLEKLFNKNS
jgi:RimK family alpha-L-glutamate ligase